MSPDGNPWLAVGLASSRGQVYKTTKDSRGMSRRGAPHAVLGSGSPVPSVESGVWLLEPRELRSFQRMKMPEIIPPGLAVRIAGLVRHRAMELFVLEKGPVEGLRQPPGKHGAGDDTGVHPALRPFEIPLAEVQEKFEGVVADLEIIGIAPFQAIIITARTCAAEFHGSPQPFIQKQE